MTNLKNRRAKRRRREAQQAKKVNEAAEGAKSLGQEMRALQGNGPVQREKVSQDSKTRLAEAIEEGDTDTALREVFHILTGEEVGDVLEGTEE